MIVIIDNYDSFSYNLYQYIAEALPDSSEKIEVIRNDQASVLEIKALGPRQVVISPGPCTPTEAGISKELVKEFVGKIPILGVCLGHQSIVEALGGKIVRASTPVHGKQAQVSHDNRGIFHNLEPRITVARYHSLVVEPNSLPECFEVSAWSESNEIMAVRHKQNPSLIGLQFHPESILTPAGKDLIRNFTSLPALK